LRPERIRLIISFASLASVLACKDSTPSGPQAFDTQSASLTQPLYTKVAEGCKRVHGDVDLTLIPSPNDPFGRSMGTSTGSLKGAVSSVLTSIAPTGGGALDVASLETLVTGPGDVVTSTATSTYTPIPSTPIGTMSVVTTQTIVGGFGKYAGATGTLQVTGTGYNVFGPDAGPGNTHFDLKYDGTICT
jgi:hypothetical protein